MFDNKSPKGSLLLDLAIRRIKCRSEAKQLFLMWPSLKEASLRLCTYLSPFLEANGVPLIDLALSRAIGRSVVVQRSEQVGVFVAAVASITEELCGLQVSVQDRDGDWAIWDFESSIVDWMGAYQQECIQIRTRETRFPAGSVRFAILRVFSIRDLMRSQLMVSV